MRNSYAVVCSIVATLSSLIYGYDSGIISTTLGQASFPSYFNNPSEDVTGAIVSSYSGAQAIGNLAGGYMGDKFGRKRTMWISSAAALIGGILQTAATNIYTFLVGRILAGFAIGPAYAISSIYNAEISPPKTRGVMVGMQTMLLSIGFAGSNWIGVFGSFAKGTAQWRIPLGLQCFPAIGLIIGLFWLPESPRWLIQQGRIDDARKVIGILHVDENCAEQEFNQIQQQLEYEKENVVKSWWYLFTKPSVRRRLLLGMLLQVFLQTTGILVVNYYQTRIYANIGLTGRNVLWISAGYGSCGVVANGLSLMYIDRVGRRKPLAWSSVALTIDMLLILIFTWQYTDNDNKVGQGFTILWFFALAFIFSLGFNTMQLVYIAEIFPMGLRSKATSLCAFMGTAVSVLFNQLSPRAFAHIQWRYYAVFVVCDAIATVCFFTIYPETKGKTLEEIAGIFGDEVAFTEYIMAADSSLEAHVTGFDLKDIQMDAEVEQVEDAANM